MRINRDTLTLYGLVASGGALGSLARAAVGLLPFSAHTLWSVWAINITGSFLLAAIMTLSLEADRLGAEPRLFLGTGVMGGFTTFSTYEVNTIASWGSLPIHAILYSIGTVIAAVIAAFLGQVAVRYLWLKDEFLPEMEEEAS